MVSSPPLFIITIGTPLDNLLGGGAARPTSVCGSLAAYMICCACPDGRAAEVRKFRKPRALQLSDCAYSRRASNAAIPRTKAFAIKVHIVGHDDLGKIFRVLVAKMAREPEANGGAMVGGLGLAIHAIGKERLRMKGFGHVDAVPQCAHNAGILIVVREWNERDISRLGARFDEVQQMGEPHAGPLGNVGPAFLAGMQQYATFRGQALELVEGKGCGARDHSLDLDAPVLETVREQGLIGFVRGGRTVHDRDL